MHSTYLTSFTIPNLIIIKQILLINHYYLITFNKDIEINNHAITFSSLHFDENVHEGRGVCNFSILSIIVNQTLNVNEYYL